MKVLVTGVNGQLGFDLIKELEKRNIEYVGTDKDDFDITDEKATRKFIVDSKADFIFHCAAYTAVDKAEDEPELCHDVNVKGTENIAVVCKDLNITMFYISTDYVFTGDGELPFEVDSPTGPLNVYGQTKLTGEEIVKNLLNKYFIVRISWVFGVNGNNFIKTMLRLAQERKEINVIHDQVGSPTYTADLAVLLCDMLLSNQYGVYHATNEGFCSWAEFAEEIFRLAGKEVKVNRIKTEEYPTKAVRPKNSRLSKEKLKKLGVKCLPDWKDAIKRFLLEYNTTM